MERRGGDRVLDVTLVHHHVQLRKQKSLQLISKGVHNTAESAHVLPAVL